MIPRLEATAAAAYIRGSHLPHTLTYKDGEPSCRWCHHWRTILRILHPAINQGDPPESPSLNDILVRWQKRGWTWEWCYGPAWPVNFLLVSTPQGEATKRSFSLGTAVRAVEGLYLTGEILMETPKPKPPGPVSTVSLLPLLARWKGRGWKWEWHKGGDDIEGVTVVVGGAVVTQSASHYELAAMTLERAYLEGEILA